MINANRMQSGLRIVASVVLVAALLTVMFAGWRYNSMMGAAREPVELCEKRPADFKMVEMKVPACVSRVFAAEWNANQNLLNGTFAIYGMLFLVLWAAQRLSDDREKRR